MILTAYLEVFSKHVKRSAGWGGCGPRTSLFLFYTVQIMPVYSSPEGWACFLGASSIHSFLLPTRVERSWLCQERPLVDTLVQATDSTAPMLSSRETNGRLGSLNSNCFVLCLHQVSHHPPISACHAESGNFVFWQGNVLIRLTSAFTAVKDHSFPIV